MKKRIVVVALSIVIIAGLLEARGGGHGGGHGGHHGGRGGHHAGHHSGRGGHHHGGHRGGHYGRGGYGHHGYYGRGYGYGGYGYGWGNPYWAAYGTSLAVGATAATVAAANANRNNQPAYSRAAFTNQTPARITISTDFGDFHIGSGQSRTINYGNNQVTVNAAFNRQSINFRIQRPNIMIRNIHGALKIKQY